MILSVVYLAALALSADQMPAKATTADDPIVVEGRKGEGFKQALRTVTDMTMTVESQIARFQDGVCPLVLGMERSAAAVVENRIRTIVQRVGAPLAGAKCEGNLLLFITENGAQLVQDIRIHRPKWLEGVSKSDKQRLLSEGPARAWSVSSLRNEDGARPAVKDSYFKPCTSGSCSGAGKAIPSGLSLLRVRRASFLENVTRYDMDGSVIVIDADAAEGLTLRQLGDFAAFRGLARIRKPQEIGSFDTILTIFDLPKHNAPLELTPFDQRYLAALYSHHGSKGFQSAVHERQRLAKAIVEDD